MVERLLQPECEAYLGPVAVAQFVEAKWLDGAPLCWTIDGLRAAAKGQGLWSGSQQRLPFPCAPSRWNSGAFWDGRKIVARAPLQGGRP